MAIAGKLRPTTAIALLVLTAAGAGALYLSHDGGPRGAVAARVGQQVISESEVSREVEVIRTQPAYAAALSGALTTALSAPVDPRAVAAAGGDPDDLRVTPVSGPVSSTAATPPTRTYSALDVQAAVLSRQIYVTALRAMLKARHVSPTAAEQLAGRQQARISSGFDRSGRSLFDALPAWYQDELASRGADVAALERSIVGDAGVTSAQIRDDYAQHAPVDFTLVCLRSMTVADAPAATSAVARVLAGDRSGLHDSGCAFLNRWAPDISRAVAMVATGAVASPVARDGRVTVLQVDRRAVLPLEQVAGAVRASLSGRYADLIKSTVQAQISLDGVSVAARYGTFEDQGPTQGVVPPDALAPANAATPGPGAPPGPAATLGPQQLDPFD